jgi:hypothetical protein
MAIDKFISFHSQGQQLFSHEQGLTKAGAQKKEIKVRANWGSLQIPFDISQIKRNYRNIKK